MVPALVIAGSVVFAAALLAFALVMELRQHRVAGRACNIDADDAVAIMAPPLS